MLFESIPLCITCISTTLFYGDITKYYTTIDMHRVLEADLSSLENSLVNRKSGFLSAISCVFHTLIKNSGKLYQTMLFPSNLCKTKLSPSYKSMALARFQDIRLGDHSRRPENIGVKMNL